MKKLIIVAIFMLVSANVFSQAFTKVIGITRSVIISGYTVRVMYNGLTNVKLIKYDSSTIVSGSEITGAAGFYTFTVPVPGFYRLYVNNTRKDEYGIIQIATFLDSLGTVKMGAVFDMNSHKITNLTNPTSAQDAMTKAYADATYTGGGGSASDTSLLLHYYDSAFIAWRNRPAIITSAYTFNQNVTLANTKQISYNGNLLWYADSATVAFINQQNAFTQTQTFAQTIKVGNGTSAIMNFNFANLDDGLLFQQNGTTLLEYEGDQAYWDFKSPIRYNGVAIPTFTTLQSTRLTFTDKITFSDSALFNNRNKFTDYTLFEDTVRLDEDFILNGYLNMSGGLVGSDMTFSKGSTAKIGTGDDQDFTLKRNNVDGLKLEFGGTEITGYLETSGNITSGATIEGLDINATSSSSVGTTLDVGGKITGSADLQINGNTTLVGNNDVGGKEVIDDSLRVEKTSLFKGVATFLVSPVFSAMVTFANGITTTTLIANGIATFNSDVVFTGWKKNQSSVSKLQYEKEKIVAMKIGLVNVVTSVAHGVPNWNDIRSFNFVVKEDTVNTIYPGGYNVSSNINVGTVYYIDSLNVNYYCPIGAYGISGDSAFFRIVYTDPSR